MNLRKCHVWIFFATITLGAGGLVGQVLLWRELLAVYQGNELITGIILANWLLAEAAGALCSSKWPKGPERAFPVFAILSCLFVLCLPASMVAARLVRGWMNIALGQPVGPWFVLLSSGLILTPVSFLHGALFPVMGRLFRNDLSMASGRAVGELYVWESLGTLLGALLLVFYLLGGGHGFRLAAALWLASSLVLLCRQHIANGRGGMLIRLFVTVVAMLGLFALVVGADRLHIWTQTRQFAPYPVLAGVSSPYGIWTVLDNDGQYLFVVDGQPTYSTPVPDRVWVEEFAHIPLLIQPAPRYVCVIGGGVGGLLSEILKHPVVEVVDYVERDPALFELFKRFMTDLTEKELQDPRVRLHALDGRLFLQQPGDYYDVILVGAPQPDTLHANRYFTESFFQMLRERLKPGGIIAVGLPGRMAYDSLDLRHLQASIYTALQRAVGNVRVLPDDGRFLYLASPDLALEEIVVDDLLGQLFARGLEDTVGMPRHIEQRLHPGWMGWIADYFQEIPMRSNRDFHPLGLLHYLSYHQSIHAPWSAAMMRWLRIHGAIIAGVVLCALFFAERCTRHRRSASVTVQCQVASTGFAGMLLDLLVIFAFQSVLGSVHVWIGLLMAAFMAGAALSAAWVTRWAVIRPNRIISGLRMCDVLLCLFCLILPVLFFVAAGLSSFSRSASIVFFMGINVMAGGVTGMLFAMAAAWRGARSDDAGQSAGHLQAADLAGGWVAGMIGATLLLPLFGVYGTCFLLAGIKGLSLLSGSAIIHLDGKENNYD